MEIQISNHDISSSQINKREANAANRLKKSQEIISGWTEQA